MSRNTRKPCMRQRARFAKFVPNVVIPNMSLNGTFHDSIFFPIFFSNFFFQPEITDNKRKNKLRCMYNRYEIDSSRGVKATSFVSIPFSFRFFFSNFFFCCPLFRVQGFAHLRHCFASVLPSFFLNVLFRSFVLLILFLFLLLNLLTKLTTV